MTGTAGCAMLIGSPELNRFLKTTNSIAQLTKGVILATEFDTFFIDFLRVLMD